MDEADLSEIVDAPVTVFDSTPDTGAHLRRRASEGAPHGTFAVAASLHERLLARADAVETDDGFAAVLDDWRARAATLGETVRVERRDGQVLTGEPVDVDDRGALVVETDEGKRRVTEGECERLRRR
jgi:BirA family biotin operon repressor/biotin-[acetyl-CoA-carboxylase] ligase